MSKDGLCAIVTGSASGLGAATAAILAQGGARILALFGDVATELLIRNDGDEGLFAAYHSVEFLAPVYAGDYIEAEGHIIRFGNRSREIAFGQSGACLKRPGSLGKSLWHASS